MQLANIYCKQKRDSIHTHAEVQMYLAKKLLSLNKRQCLVGFNCLSVTPEFQPLNFSDDLYNLMQKEKKLI